MNKISAFLHVIEGRLRLKLPEVKGAPAEARTVEAQLQGLTGVNHVTANPVTGSVLILYDTDQTGIEEITGALESWGYLRHPVPAPGTHTPTGFSFGLGSLVLRATTEVALQQLFVALI